MRRPGGSLQPELLRQAEVSPRKAPSRIALPQPAAIDGPVAVGLDAAAISPRSVFSAATKISENVGKGWIVSRRTSSETWAEIARVACWSHSPASGPTA